MSVFAVLAASPGLFIGACLVLGTRGRQLSERRDLPPAPHARAAVARAVCGIRAPGSGRDHDPRRLARAVQPRRAALGVPVVQGAHHGAAEHTPALLARAARALRPLRHAHSRALPAGGALNGHSQRGGRLEVRLWLAGARRPFLHLVPDRPDLHRRRSSAAPGQSDAAAAVVRSARSACAAHKRPPWASPSICARA